MIPSEKIKIFCIENDISIAELGRRLGKSSQAFSQKVKRGVFTIQDLEDIAAVTGVTLECAFIMPGGERFIINI